MILRASALIFCILATSCGPTLDPDKAEPYRCFEGADLHQLITAEAPSQLSGFNTSRGDEMSEQRLFDGTQVAELPLEIPGPFGGHLCERLRDQLARRCDVKDFWVSADACVGAVESPAKAITAQDGTYKLRPVKGRVALIVTKTQDGKSKVVLTTTEWKN
jgi:hypothetical protein